MMKKWILGTVVLSALLSAWHIGSRCYVLHNFCRDPDVCHRVSVVPTELDLSKVRDAQGVTCSVGYAEFMIPSSESLQLRSFDSESTAVVGETASMRFILMSPFDPSSPTQAATDLKNGLSNLPKHHPFREKFSSIGTTPLDFEITAEEMIPPSFWKIVFQDSKLFALNAVLLGFKGNTTGMGMRSVHTYQTPETRGLIRVGEHPDDMSKAHVSLENRKGSLAVGMYVFTSKNNTNDVANIFPVILKTFRFTMDELRSQDDVKQAIAKAGIPPREEESLEKPSTTSE